MDEHLNTDQAVASSTLAWRAEKPTRDLFGGFKG